MSDDNRENIQHHLLQRTRYLNAEIATQEQIRQSAEHTITQAKKTLLNLHAERQAILERAIDYGYNPEDDEY